MAFFACVTHSPAIDILRGRRQAVWNVFRWSQPRFSITSAAQGRAIQGRAISGGVVICFSDVRLEVRGAQGCALDRQSGSSPTLLYQRIMDTLVARWPV